MLGELSGWTRIIEPDSEEDIPHRFKITKQDFGAGTDETGEAPWIYRVRYLIDDVLSGGWISENDITDDPSNDTISNDESGEINVSEKTVNRLSMLVSPLKTLKIRFKFAWQNHPMLVIGAILGDQVILSVLVKFLFF